MKPLSGDEEDANSLLLSRLTAINSRELETPVTEQRTATLAR